MFQHLPSHVQAIDAHFGHPSAIPILLYQLKIHCLTANAKVEIPRCHIAIELPPLRCINPADPYRQSVQLNGQRIHSRVPVVVNVSFKSVPINNPTHPKLHNLVPRRSLRGGTTKQSINSSRNSIEESEEPLPTFSQEVEKNLPLILQRITADSVSAVDADLLILGSLTVFSACIPNVYGVYDRREVFANLFLFVTARASAGKGRLTLCIADFCKSGQLSHPAHDLYTKVAL